jgi:hypothetical protein
MCPSAFVAEEFFTGTYGTSHHFLLIVLSLYFGDSTTKEAEKTAEVLGKFVGEIDASDSEKTNFVFLMSQVKSRKVVVENSFFKVDWSVLVTVRVEDLQSL